MNTPFHFPPSKFHIPFLTRLRERLSGYLTRHPLRVGIPVLALAVGSLAAVIAVTSCTVCCSVSSNGQRVVCCPDTATLGAAMEQAEVKAAAILHRPYTFDADAVSVRTTVAPKGSVEAVAEVTDSLLDAIPEIQHVYTLTVDGVYIGANEDPAVLDEALSEAQKRYETSETVSTHVDNDISIQWEYIPAYRGTLTKQALIDALLAETPKTFPYVVQAQDDPVTVAENFGLTLARLQALNPGIDLSVYVEAESILNGASQQEAAEETPQREVSPYAALANVSKPGETDDDKDASPYAALADRQGTEEETDDSPDGTVSIRDFLTSSENPLQVGQTLTIEQSCPLLEVTTVEETAFIRAIEPSREVQVDDSLYAGQERILQEGSAGYADVVARQVRRCGVLTASVDLSVETTAEPVPVIVACGSQPIPSFQAGGLFQWPVRGNISSDFGYRFIFGSTSFHRGVDIAAPMGTPICAADSGTVVYAGVRGTYGNLVVISHPSGLYTYYGHCSQIFAKMGDVVNVGDPIAAVGSTGRSTGPHCHFEVRYENAPIDPLQFLPGENNAPVRSVPVATAPELMTPAADTAGTPAAQSAQASTVHRSGSGTSGIISLPLTPIPVPAEPSAPETPETQMDTPAEQGQTPSPIFSISGPNLFSPSQETETAP